MYDCRPVAAGHLDRGNAGDKVAVNDPAAVPLGTDEEADGRPPTVRAGSQRSRTIDSAAQAKRNIRAAIESVAARLGNRPTICRKCSVHPEVLTSYLDGTLVLEIKQAVEQELRDELSKLRPEEAAVLAMLRGHLAKNPSKRGRRC